ncbi:MAG: STAS domain-containing protein [Chloroflexota bacterium]
MAGKGLKADVRQRDGLAVLELDGELDGFGEETLNIAYVRAEATKPQAVLLKFEQVAYINSTGIALVVQLLGRARRAGLPLLACGLSEHFQEIFRITRLADFVHVVADEASALRAVPSGG